MKVIKTVAHLMYNTCRGLNSIAKYQYVVKYMYNESITFYFIHF